MANDPWADFRTGPAPTAPVREDTIISGPDPYKQGAEVRADRGDARADTSLGVTLRNEKRGIEEKDFSQAKSLRDEFSKSPEVQKYKTIVNQFAAGVSAGDNTAGDQKLINAYAQMLNPTSTVMLGEYEATAEVDSAIQRAKTKIMREIGWDGVGRLSPEGRRKVLGEMSALEKESGNAFNQQWNYYAEQAKRNGFDPFDVVGPHARDPYQTTFQKYDEDRRARGELNDGGPMGGQPPAPGGGPNGGVTNPELRGGLPVGTDVTFGKQEPDWWDRDKALKEKFGVTPDQEQLITAFWNQNGDTASPQAIKQWYSSQGLPVPTDDVIRHGIQHGRKGGDFGSFDLSAEKAAYENQIKVNLDSQGFDPNSAGAYSDRVMQGGLMGLGDELSGVLGGVDALVNNRGVASGYTDARNTARMALEQESKAQGFTGNALEFAGSLATGLKIPGSPVRSAATAGGIAGFGYGNGAQDSGANALLGAAVGAGAAKGGEMASPYIARGANALAQRLPGRGGGAIPDAAQVAADGAAEGITVNNAMLRPSMQNRVTGVDASLAGGPKFQRGMSQIEGQIEGRVSDLGQGGQPMDRIAAGQAYQAASERSIKNSGKAAKAKYDRAEQLAGDAKVEPRGSLKLVNDMIGQLGETAGINSNEIAFLKTIQGDLSKDLSVGALRRMRTTLRKKISKGELVFGEDEARVLSIMDSAADDIKTGLQAQGKGAAAKAFEIADGEYRARMEYINGTLQKIIGKRGQNLTSEKIADNLASMARGKDSDGVRRFLASLTSDERADVAATFAEEIGKNGKDGFSVAHFLSQTTEKKFPDASLRAIFGDEGAASIIRLRNVGKEVNRVTGAMNSRKSGTAVGNDYRSWLFNTLVGAAGGGMSGGSFATAVAGAATTAGLKASRDVLSARALLSPEITKWIATAPRSVSPQAINGHLARLSKVTASRMDAQAIQEYLRKVITESPASRAAADDQDK